MRIARRLSPLDRLAKVGRPRPPAVVATPIGGAEGPAGADGAPGKDGADGKEGPPGAATMADYKESVRVATTANVTISTALNNGDSIDGVSLVNGDRVLVANQTTKSQNGIYIVGASPARSTDADGAGELSGGTLVYVEQGTIYGGRVMRITTAGSITPGTTAHDWAPLMPKDHGILTSPPTSAALVGDLWQHEASEGVLWEFRYTGKGGSPWAKVGGPPLHVFDNDERSLTNQTTFANLPTDPMSIAAPLAGEYDIRVEGDIAVGGAGNGGYLSYAVGATAANDSWGAHHSAASATTTRTAKAMSTERHAVGKGDSIAEKGRTGGNYTVTFRRRHLWIDPVRVG